MSAAAACAASMRAIPAQIDAEPRFESTLTACQSAHDGVQCGAHACRFEPGPHMRKGRKGYLLLGGDEHVVTRVCERHESATRPNGVRT